MDAETMIGSLEREVRGAMESLPDPPRPIRPDALTAREREVVERALAGSSNKAIAYDLGIADATVRVLLWRAYGKLGVRSRREMLAKASTLSAWFGHRAARASDASASDPPLHPDAAQIRASDG